MVEHITSAVQDYFHLQRPTRDRQASIFSQLNTLNAQRVQQTYKWNRRKCVPAITDGTSSRCLVDMEDTFAYFTTVWETQPPPVERSDVTPPTTPPVVNSLTQAFVESCLKTVENSAPSHMITYRHWREVNPSCSVLTRVFNICLKLSNIPAKWKSSRTVLIHKKGDVGQLENWRPISLSDTMYKLFAKCMARKLSDWCETFEVISPLSEGLLTSRRRAGTQLPTDAAPRLSTPLPERQVRRVARHL
ncbi:uncharacterized protein TNCV_3513451 [Trichonephila clavipes]|nr:uncharacterized protein TNCV_3513451 [Trichonephila clavipes]